jgi:hypothetical protein
MTKHALAKRFGSVEWLARFVLAIALLVLLWLSARPLIGPASVSAGTEGRFSAERAMEDLRVVAREPHPAGSEAQARVRDYILAQAAASGLDAEVQKGGGVENVIVRLPGTDPTGIVLVTGHYDSQPPAPGAGDDGISVAAMLETMRVLSSGASLRNDALFLFADGEEMGYLGSKAFIKGHPGAEQEPSILLCFDARPGNGPITLRETSPGDGWLVRQLAASRPALYANSYLSFGERGEIDTDCAAFIAAGYAGMEIENAPSGTAYHTARDTADAISSRLVQAYGTTMERSVRRFGGLDLSKVERTQDLAFFSVPLVGIVAYPAWLTPVAAILGMAGLAVFIVLAWRRRQLLLVRMLLGALALLAAAVAFALLANLAWKALLETFPVTREATLGYLDFEGSGWWKAGMMATALLLGVAVVYGLLRPIRGVSLAAGGIVAFLVVVWLAYFLMDSDNPTATLHMAWPLLGGVAGLAALVLVRRCVSLAACLFLAAIPVLVLMVPTLWLLSLELQDGAWLPVLLMELTLGLLVPHIAFVTGQLQAAISE